MAYKQRWLQYFEVHDANHNGYIEPSDAALLAKRLAPVFGIHEGTPQYQHLLKAFEETLTNLIHDFSTNKDNRVTKEELIAGVEKHFIGKDVGQFPKWWKDNVNFLFAAFDKNKNGRLSLKEVTNLLKRLDPHESNEKIALAYKFATEHSPDKGAFTARTLLIISHIWATSPQPTPEADTLLAFLHKAPVVIGYKERWSQYFDVHDADGNGFIEPKDAALLAKRLAPVFDIDEGTPEYQHLLQAFESTLTNLIHDFSLNKDNRVTKDELLAGVERHFIGKDVEHFPKWWKENVNILFAAFDKNKNGVLSLLEVTYLLKRLDPHESNDKIALAYKWAQEHSPDKGAYNAHTMLIISHIWATSPNSTPEADTLLAFLNKVPVRVGYKERWAQFFDVHDANGNGFIEPNDAAILAKSLAPIFEIPEGTPEYKLLVQAFQSSLDNLIKDFDFNKDGKVSKEELLAGVEKLFIGKDLEHFPKWWKDSVHNLFSAFDKNKNGVLSLEEVTHLLKRLDAHESNEKIALAYKYAQGLSPHKGAYNAETMLIISHIWATSPNPTPEADVLLAFLHKNPSIISLYQ